MRQNRLLTSFIALLLCSTAPAQTRLSDSRQNSPETFIYKIEKEELRRIYLKEKEIDESMLHSFVASYGAEDSVPSLPKGNYLTVRATDNRLQYSDLTVDDFRFGLIESDNIMLHLYNSSGQAIDHATVRYGHKRLKFDARTQTYTTSRIRNEKLIEVEHHGVYHYIEIETPYRHKTPFYKNFRTIWWRLRSALHSGRSNKTNHSNFVVFSKPIYKPGETVKLKAYLTNRHGKPRKAPAEIRLAEYRNGPDTLLTTLRPYRPGMYEYAFRLSDSLRLRLDKDYAIRVGSAEEWFRYEEYELKKNTFTAHTSKDTYLCGDTVRLLLKARDENDMAVYDGKATLTVTPSNIMHHAEQTFVPDTLWRHTVDMNGSAPTEIVLPDSIFPRGVSLSCSVRCVFLNAENERQERIIRFRRDGRERLLDFAVDQGILTIRQLVNGRSAEKAARITTRGRHGEIIRSDSVQLPYSAAIPWYVSDYEVKTSDEQGTYHTGDYRESPLKYELFRQEDTVRLTVDNPAGIPFWYRIIRGKRMIENGYATSLDYRRRERGNGAYSLQLAYLFGNASKHITESLPFTQKNMFLDVTTPQAIYPGQTTTVDIAVSDKAGKPIGKADITAWAVTSKFDSRIPSIPIPGKTRYPRKVRERGYRAEEYTATNRMGKLSWERWKKEMGLDTIEYYKFLHPSPVYAYAEPDRGGITQIAPYVVIDGDVKGVEILWIDDQPHFFAQAEQFGVYSFPVAPGEHTLRMRIYDREVTLNDAEAVTGMKTILSVDGSRNTDRVTVAEYKKSDLGVLSDRELSSLSRYMITIDSEIPKLNLPGAPSFEVPALLNSGGVCYWLNEQPAEYGYAQGKRFRQPRLAGPFPNRSGTDANIATLYADTALINRFEIEGGYNYTVRPGYLKLKSWGDTPFQTRITPFTQSVSFASHALTPEEIRTGFRKKQIDAMIHNRGRIESSPMPAAAKCRLQIEMGKMTDGETAVKPTMIFFSPGGICDTVWWVLYTGGTRYFTDLPAGSTRITLIFADSTSYSTLLTLRPNGRNYKKIDRVTSEFAPYVARMTHAVLENKIARINRTHTDDSDVIPAHRAGKFSRSNEASGVVSGIVRNNDGEPVAGATVIIDRLGTGAIADASGRFGMKYPLSDLQDKKFTVSYLGYSDLRVEMKPGYDYELYLTESNTILHDIAVANEEGITADALSGRAAGTLLRALPLNRAKSERFVTDKSKPLVIVDGAPYSGKIDDLEPGSIVSMNEANGVIIIWTTGKTVNQQEEADAGQSLRHNFHDDAFWQPRITTDKAGKARFEVTWPDDITGWKARFIAIGGRRKIDKKEIAVNSFKTLTARLNLPQFAVRGDSLNVVGKVVSHSPDTVRAKTTVAVGGRETSNDIAVVSSHVDLLPINVTDGDSVRVRYSILRDNGYFDGEERTIPVYERGTLETRGRFMAIGDTQMHRFETDPGLGAATIHAEASAMELFLREIQKVNDYPYLCNEQMASKIKALLAAKRICAATGIRFREEAEINSLIERLNRNRNNEGLWGWWNRDKTEFWIARQVIEAMIWAEKEGYETDIEKSLWATRLLADLNRSLFRLHGRTDEPSAKTELLGKLVLLKELGATIDYGAYYDRIDRLENRSLRDKLSAMYALSAVGLGDRIDLDTLMSGSSSSVMGALYWPDSTAVKGNRPAPDANDVENTLTAYRILRNLGGHDAQLEQIRNYFFEQRRNGQWRNTYESSRIIETIMPDMLRNGEKFTEVSAEISGVKIDKFPYTAQADAGTTVEVQKNGTAPLFFTVYQQSWNPDPKPEVKGFTVSSRFKSDKDSVSLLRAGETAELEVIVDVPSDAGYVMIEIPVPAGCSYESKTPGNWYEETHREYFKEKVSIFCKRLSKGKHKFTVKLIPRYTGLYHLNPARAELMYFPTCYGHTEMKEVVVE